MELVWDQIGERRFETGVDHGVLFIPDANGAYVNGVAWNGLETITEKPTGAAPTAKYADNIKYLNLRSAEQFGGDIQALTYPDEWDQFQGVAEPSPGVQISQQHRKTFGLSYRTLLGNDVDGEDYGYKLHLVYGATASPSDKAYASVADTPNALSFSWTFDTTPVAVGNINGVDYKPTSLIVLDSTKIAAATMDDILQILYGTAGADPALPLPATIIGMVAGGVVQVAPVKPAFDQPTNTITIPTVAGVTYYNGTTGEMLAAGPVVIAADTVVQARANDGFVFPPVTDSDWLYTHV